MKEFMVIHGGILVSSKKLRKERSIKRKIINWLLDNLSIQSETIAIDTKTREALETGDEFVIRKYLNDRILPEDTPKLHIINGGT